MTDADRELLNRLLDEDLSPAEAEATRTLLENDAAAAEYFAERAALVSDLRRSLKRRRLQEETLAAVAGGERPTIGGRQGARATRWFRPSWISAAAVLVIMSMVGVAFLRNRASDGGTHVVGGGDTVVEVVETQDAVSAQKWNVGSHIPVRKIALTSGRIGLRLPGGVSLDLAGPIEADLASARELRLSRGQVTAHGSADGAQNFVVQTAQARVERGRSFAVAVGSSNQTDVVALDGGVDVNSSGQEGRAEQPKLMLAEGEAVRFDASGTPKRLKMVALSPDARSLAGPAASAVVADVRDNVAAADFRGYYGLLSGGMGEGARAYTTGHTRTWHALPGQSFPAELLGADVVCTFSVDRQEPNLQITVVVTQPCMLYVLADARATPPAWLAAEFEDTGMRMRSGPWVPRGAQSPAEPAGLAAAHVPHVVWRKRIPQAGPVVLGPPRDATVVAAPKRGAVVGAPAMYGIAVKRLP
ncbi:MAG: hypothetical protein ACAI43_09215 [Phycisphaerae bacterium]|nr:hypothetical protein [Tepidisphaeraceae bacterium]